MGERYFGLKFKYGESSRHQSRINHVGFAGQAPSPTDSCEGRSPKLAGPTTSKPLERNPCANRIFCPLTPPLRRQFLRISPNFGVGKLRPRKRAQLRQMACFHHFRRNDKLTVERGRIYPVESANWGPIHFWLPSRRVRCSDSDSGSGC